MPESRVQTTRFFYVIFLLHSRGYSALIRLFPVPIISTGEKG